MLRTFATELLLDLLRLLLFDGFVLLHFEKKIDGFLRGFALGSALDSLGRDGCWHIVDANGTVATIDKWWRWWWWWWWFDARFLCSLRCWIVIAIGIESNVEFLCRKERVGGRHFAFDRGETRYPEHRLSVLVLELSTRAFLTSVL